MLLSIYDIMGRQIRVLVDSEQPAGRHDIVVDMEDMPSGVYAYRLVARAFSKTRQMTLVR